MKKALLTILFIGAFFVTNISQSFAFDINYKPAGFVNDFANVLSVDTKSRLESELASFKASTTNEIVVAIIPNMGGRYIEEYANQMFREWGIGTKANNNGVLLLFAIDEHKDRIEVGYGLEGALTDLTSNQILTEIVPSLKSGNYDAAVETAVSDIQLATAGEYVAEPASSNSVGSSFSADMFVNILFVFFFFVIPILAAILGRTKSWWLGGVIGFVLALVLFLFVIKIVWVFILTVVGLVFDYFVSKNFKQAKSGGTDPSWWAGGHNFGGGFGGGYSGSSGSSFGGFSGGSSGGGGSSGSW